MGRLYSKNISCAWKCVCACIISLLICFVLPQNQVNAAGEITTIKYYVSDNYIMKIKAETTVEELLKNIVSNNGEQLKIYDKEKEVGLAENIKTGMELRVGTSKTYILVVRGDINPDGKITPTDLSQLKKHNVGISKLEGEKLKAADINYNGEITALDVSQLKMLLVGLELPEVKTSTGNIIVTPDTTEAAKEVKLKIEVRENADIEYDKIKVSLDNGSTWEMCDGTAKITENKEVRIRLVKEFTYEIIDDSNMPKFEFKVDPETGEEYIEITEENEQYFQGKEETYDEYVERMIKLGVMKKIKTTEDVTVEEDTYIVNNIDNIAPNEFEFTAEVTTNTIKIKAETTDTMKNYKGETKNDGIAGIKTYEYRTANTEWQSSNEIKGLSQNTEYKIYVRAIDYAGNIREATNNGETVKTKNIEIANASIKFEYSNTNITNEDVVITMSCKELEGTGLKIQYQVNGTTGTWENGEKYIAKGNCEIYARIADNENQEGKGEYAKASITNIDKLSPNEFTPEIIEKTNTNIKIRVTVEDKEATETSCKSGIESYTYHILNDKAEEIKVTEETTNEYNFTELDLENTGYYIYVTAKDKAGNTTVSGGISVGKIENKGLGIGVINPGPDNVTINDGAYRYFNPVIPVGFKAINTEEASWEGVMPRDWNKGLVIEDKYGNQFVWVPVDGTAVKYEKGTKVWDYGDNAEWEKLTSQIAGDELPLSLKGINEEEKGQIEKYEGFYVSRYEAGNADNTLGSKEGLKVVNAVTYEQAKNYAESMYRQPKVKSGLLTGTMWDTMTKWISNEKGEKHVINNINSGNTYETAFTFSGMYATGPNSVTEKRSEYLVGTNINKQVKRRVLLTTGIVEKFKDKNIYDTAGNVWEYTSEYLINEENTKQYIARGGNYYWAYDKIVAAGTALREYVSELEGEERNEGGFRIALFLVEGATEVGVFEDFNRTIDGNKATYKNPVIPAGFAAVNTGANWGNGITTKPDYNNGLVIEDINGNEFVWVPVDKTEVKYEKWTKTGASYEDTTGDDKAKILSTWNEEEETQIEKYGGFYVARYETSISEEGKAQTQADKEVLLNRAYEEIKSISEDMGIKEKVKKYVGTGLITGTQWDTIMRWIANEIGEEKILQDSTSWGTYGENILKTGATLKKNIYDIAGNAWEMTSEKQGEENRIYRGGVCLDRSIAVAYRGSKNLYYKDAATGARMVLYVTGEISQEASMVPIQDDTPLNGTRGTPPIPAASESVTISPSTKEWTNKDVDIEIKNTNPYYITQYQINGTTGKWNRDKKFTVTENCTIYSRLANSKGQGGESIKYVVGNIDKIAPNEFTPVVSKMRYNQIVLLCNVSDNLSGPGKYKYYLNGMPVYTGTENTYTINGLTEKTTYTLYVEVWDKAGNYRKSKEITVTTPDKSLANVVSTGQYVNYNAGGTNKWRVYSIDNDRVTLICDSMNKLARARDDYDWRAIHFAGGILEGYNGNVYFDTVTAQSGNMYKALNQMCQRFYMNSFAESARSVHEDDLETLKKLGLLSCSRDPKLAGLLLRSHQGYSPTVYMVAQDKIKTFKYEYWYGDSPSTETGYILKFVWCEISQVREESTVGFRRQGEERFCPSNSNIKTRCICKRWLRYSIRPMAIRNIKLSYNSQPIYKLLNLNRNFKYEILQSKTIHSKWS